MIDKIFTFLNTLEARERIVLIIGTILVVIIIGFYFITLPLYQKNQKLKNILSKEIQNYKELSKLASEYASIKPNTLRQKHISLTEIEQLSQIYEIKNSITSIRPITFEGEKSIEVLMKNVPAEKVIRFLKALEKKGYKLKFISIYDPKGNRKLTVRVVIGE